MFGELYTIHKANNTKMGQNSTSQIPVKSEHVYSPTYPEHVFGVIGLVCAVTALITNCEKSQNATARIPYLSQFVTVAICDGSKCNFSDSCS